MNSSGCDSNQSTPVKALLSIRFGAVTVESRKSSLFCGKPSPLMPTGNNTKLLREVAATSAHDTAANATMQAQDPPKKRRKRNPWTEHVSAHSHVLFNAIVEAY
jgi:hypothetical protein